MRPLRRTPHRPGGDSAGSTDTWDWSTFRDGRRRWEKYRERRRKHVGVSFTEFADLSDGRRAILRSDRGLNWGWRHSPGPWYGTTRESLTDEIRGYLAAEEEDCCPISPESVVELVQRYYDIGSRRAIG